KARSSSISVEEGSRPAAAPHPSPQEVGSCNRLLAPGAARPPGATFLAEASLSAGAALSTVPAASATSAFPIVHVLGLVADGGPAIVLPRVHLEMHSIPGPVGHFLAALGRGAVPGVRANAEDPETFQLLRRGLGERFQAVRGSCRDDFPPETFDRWPVAGRLAGSDGARLAVHEDGLRIERGGEA